MTDTSEREDSSPTAPLVPLVGVPQGRLARRRMTPPGVRTGPEPLHSPVTPGEGRTPVRESPGGGAAARPGVADSPSPSRRRGMLPPKLHLTSSPADGSVTGSSSPVWTPAPGRVCVVLDFDLTLAQCHVYKELRRLGFNAKASELGREKIFGDEDRIKMLDNFLRRVRQQGSHVAVLTNNTEEAVGECLTIGGLAHHIDEVISVDPLSSKGRDMRRLRPHGVTRWVFADDDRKNIASVERETRGRVPTVLVDGGRGLQQRHITAIEQAAYPPDFAAAVLRRVPSAQLDPGRPGNGSLAERGDRSSSSRPMPSSMARPPPIGADGGGAPLGARTSNFGSTSINSTAVPGGSGLEQSGCSAARLRLSGALDGPPAGGISPSREGSAAPPEAQGAGASAATVPACSQVSTELQHRDSGCAATSPTVESLGETLHRAVSLVFMSPADEYDLLASSPARRGGSPEVGSAEDRAAKIAAGAGPPRCETEDSDSEVVTDMDFGASGKRSRQHTGGATTDASIPEHPAGGDD